MLRILEKEVEKDEPIPEEGNIVVHSLAFWRKIKTDGGGGEINSSRLRRSQKGKQKDFFPQLAREGGGGGMWNTVS